MSSATVPEQLPEGEHALLSPSGAERWINCPGSIEAERGLPDSPSEYAAEGTVAHTVGETCILSGEQAESMIGKTFTADGFTFTVDHEMAEAVQVYLDHVAGLKAIYHDEPELVTAVEQRVYTSIPECYGTADFLLWAPKSRHLHVVDYKHGKGKRVIVKDNLQLLIYAWAAGRGLYNSINAVPERVTIHVVQPRINNVHFEHYTLDELAPFIRRIEQAAEAALQPGAPRVPGEAQCQWCKAKPTCPELGRYVDDTVVQLFPVVGGEIGGDSTQPDVLAQAMSRVDLVKAWVKSVEDRVFEMLEVGVPVPGYKLVSGRALRKWGLSDEDVKAELRKRKLKVADIVEQKLKSVAQLEKTLGKKVFNDKVGDLVVKPEGRPVIAVESDPRPAVNNGEQFPDLS